MALNSHSFFHQMADFSNLLGEIDELDQTQPSLQEPEEEFNASAYTPFDPSNLHDDEPSVLKDARVNLDLQKQGLVMDSTLEPTQETSFFESQDLSDELNADDDYSMMKIFWAQEMNSPELLPHKTELYSMLLALLGHKQDILDELHSQTQNGQVDPSLSSLAANICKMDIDRLSFLLADYTRTRLEKIEMHALYNRSLIDRMSDAEVSYLKGFGELFESHMRRSVTDHIPKDAWKSLDDPEMIEKPDMNCFVFAKVVSEESVRIDRYYGLDSSSEESFDNFESGSQIFVRYACIHDLVLENKVELLM